jgi:hypothetical protein
MFLYQILNTKYKIQKAFFIALFIVLSLFAANNAHAGTIIKSPAYLGLSRGLVGCWNFDGAYTKVPDCSGNNNTGTLTNNPRKIAGKSGQGMSFPGFGDVSVDMPLVSNSTTNITLSAWVKWDGTNRESHEIFYNGNDATDGYGLYAHDGSCGAGNKLVIQMGGVTCDATSSTYSLVAGQWTYVVMTRSGNTNRLYANGVLIGEDTSNAPNTPTSSTQISGGDDFSGVIDEARFYSRALSQSEIQRLYLIGLGSKANRTQTSSLTQGLVGHWTFDGASLHGTSPLTIDDSSGLRNKASSSGAGIPTKTEGKIGQSLNFDGVNDYASTADYNAADGLSKVSFGGWLKVTNKGSGASGILTDWDTDALNGWGIEYDHDQILIGCNLRNTSDGYIIATSPYSAYDGEWHHVMCVFDGTQSGDINRSKIYIDGLQKTLTFSGTVPASLNGNNEGTIMGLDQAGGSFFYQGGMDDIRVYNRALSAGEVNRLWQQTQSRYNASKTDSLTHGLVGYWTFDGGDIGLTGTRAEDRSPSNAHGTLTSGPVVAVGKIGQALDFDGSNDYVDTARDIFYSDRLTVCAWVKPDVFDSNPRSIATKRNSSGITGAPDPEWTLYLDKSLNFAWISWAAGGAVTMQFGSNTVPKVGAWYHVCAVQNGNGNIGFIYVNGIQDGSDTQDAVMVNSSNHVQVGVMTADNSNRYFNGAIDDVRIYSRPLSASEVMKLYNMGR